MMTAEDVFWQMGQDCITKDALPWCNIKDSQAPKIKKELLHHQGGVDETHHTQPLHFCTSKQPFRLFSDLISQT